MKLQPVNIPMPRDVVREVQRSVELAEQSIRENFRVIQETVNDLDVREADVAQQVDTIGELKRVVRSAVSVPNNMWTECGDIELDTGTFIIHGYAQFGVGSGVRQVRIGKTANANTSFAVGASASAVASNAVSDDVSFSIAVELTSPIKLYMNVRQTSGSDLNAYTRISATRIR